MSSRKKLREALDLYFTDTFNYIDTVSSFIDKQQKWSEARKTESDAMIKIQTKNNGPETNKEAFINMIKNAFSSSRAEKQEAELERELTALLQELLGGLQELQLFLDALEKLAVTSVHVFEPNQVLKVSNGDDLAKVKEIISNCEKACPLLLLFKRDNEAFFSPKLQNLEVLKHQLDTYIINVDNICNHFTKSSLYLRTPVIDLNEGISEDDIEKMLLHINKLQEIRMDEAFRMVFLFRGKHSDFIKKYSLHKIQMEGFLTEMEQSAKKLDNMKKGKEISGVVSSVLGVGGGVVSIVGLALIPVTAGVSTVLIGVGAGIGTLSGGTSISTAVADSRVNSEQMEKVNKAFKKFKNNMNTLQMCLHSTINISCVNNSEENPGVENVRVGAKVVAAGKCLDTAVDCFSAACQISKVGRAAIAMSRFARGGFLAANALFIGLDVTTIVLNSVDLHKGKESGNSKLIRSRAALWRSEIESWKKIYVSLEEGQQRSEKNQEIIQTPFWVSCSSNAV